MAYQRKSLLSFRSDSHQSVTRRHLVGARCVCVRGLSDKQQSSTTPRCFTDRPRAGDRDCRTAQRDCRYSIQPTTKRWPGEEAAEAGTEMLALAARLSCIPDEMKGSSNQCLYREHTVWLFSILSAAFGAPFSTKWSSFFFIMIPRPIWFFTTVLFFFSNDLFVKRIKKN